MLAEAAATRAAGSHPLPSRHTRRSSPRELSRLETSRSAAAHSSRPRHRSNRCRAVQRRRRVAHRVRHPRNMPSRCPASVRSAFASTPRRDPQTPACSVDAHHARLGGEVERHLARRTGEAKQAGPARGSSSTSLARTVRSSPSNCAVTALPPCATAMRRTLEGQRSVGGEDDACHVGQDVEDHRHAGVVALRLAVPDLPARIGPCELEFRERPATQPVPPARRAGSPRTGTCSCRRASGRGSAARASNWRVSCRENVSGFSQTA